MCNVKMQCSPEDFSTLLIRIYEPRSNVRTTIYEPRSNVRTTIYEPRSNVRTTVCEARSDVRTTICEARSDVRKEAKMFINSGDAYEKPTTSTVRINPKKERNKR